MESKLAGMGLKSPVSSYVGAPGPNHYLAPDSALESSAQKARSLRQNRISAPGTLTASTDTRWSNQLDQVIERGPSPGLDDASVRSRSPQPDMRPKSTDFAGGAHEPPHSSSRSATPRHSAGPAAFGSGFGVGPAGSASALGLGHPSEAASPALSPHPSGSWASMTNTPLASAFSLASLGDNNTSHLAGLAAAANAAAANRDFRRPSAASRNVSGVSGFSDEARSPPALPAFPNPFGLPVPQPGADLAVLYSQLSLAATAQAQAQAAAQVQAAQAQLYGNLLLPGNQSRQPSGRVPSSGRRSPLPGQRVTSPNPAIAQQQGGGGGAGGGAGVAGPDDIDIKVLSDTSGWLRVLRLHKYTANFETTPWTDMVRMTDQDLQDKGVAAQGARSKFLKVFYNVRENRGLPHPPGQEKYAPGATEEEK
jgi:hypothetical protein